MTALTLLQPLALVGRAAQSTARHAGNMATLVWQSFMATISGKVSLRSILDAAFSMGVQSVPLAVTTGMLSGIVTTQQGGYQFTGEIPLYVLGSVVLSSVILELGPVITAFVVIGRVGANITAQIGTMQVTDQVDALYSLGREPVYILAAPRLIAGILVMPGLVAMADCAGIFAGMVAADWTLNLGPATFLYGARLYWHGWDLFYSMMKAVAFGFVIPLIAVHMGFATRGGAEGVGRATTSAVVFMIMTVLFLDAMFPPLLLG